MSKGPLKGRTARVTGASGAIGAAIALALAERGAYVLAHYRSNSAAAAELVAEISAAGGRAEAIGADISTADGVAWLYSQIAELGTAVEILVNNAGITRDALLARMSEDDWQEVISTNLTAAFRLCRGALRPMVRARSGRIINIASVAGTTGNAGQTNYSAAKAGLIGFTKALAREVAPRSITVNAVAPGFIDSPMAEAIGDDKIKQVVAMIPLGRMGTAREVAALVAFLASDEAGYITGQTHLVDGGLAM